MEKASKEPKHQPAEAGAGSLEFLKSYLELDRIDLTFVFRDGSCVLSNAPAPTAERFRLETELLESVGSTVYESGRLYSVGKADMPGGLTAYRLELVEQLPEPIVERINSYQVRLLDLMVANQDFLIKSSELVYPVRSRIDKILVNAVTMGTYIQAFGKALDAMRVEAEGADSGLDALAEELGRQAGTDRVTVAHAEGMSKTLGEVKQSLQRMAKTAGDVAATAKSAADLLVVQRSAMTQMIKFLKVIGNDIFGSLAKMDHIIYIHRLFNYIQPHISTKDFSKEDYRDCRLGKWWETGLGRQEFSDTPSYPKMGASHANIHKSANGIAAVGNDLADLIANCEAIAGKLDAMLRASEEVFKCLDDMLEERARTIDSESDERRRRLEEEAGLI